MKLLPLKIAVTSAMIVGLGVASTANAQTQGQSLDQEIFTKVNSNAWQDKVNLYLLRNQYASAASIQGLNNNIAKNKADIKTLAKAQLESATFFGEQIQENKDDISAVTGKAFKNQIDIQRNNDSIEDLYEANNDNVERLVEHDRAIEILTEAGNHHDTLIRKNKADIKASNGKIESLKTLYETTVRTVGNNEKAIEEHRKLIADNKANIKTLAKAQLESATFFGEQIQENKDDISTLTRKSFQNQVDIVRNNASIEDLYAYGEEVAKSIGEIHTHNEEQNKTLENLITNSTNNTDNIDKNKAKIQDLAKAQLESVTFLGEQIQENKDDIAANKADADAKFKGVQTDIANNKTTLAEHAKKINDNQQAIEAKLGGKADLQKLSELKTSVDKNQTDIQLHDTKITNLATLFSWTTPTIGNNTKGVATNKADIAKNKDDIQNNINNIYELAQQQDQHSSDIKTLAKASSANTDNIAKNKADADASFKTLTKNQNALIEKDKAQDALITANKADADASFKTLTKNQNTLIEKDKEHDKLITANKADADAKFKGVQTDIANNKTTLAQHAKKIDDNQQAIEAKLGGKADAQALTDLNNKVDGFDGRISALDTKVNTFDGRITALDSKVENGMAAQAALSGLFQPYSVGKFNATAALGGYGSKSAVAIGAGYRVNPNLAIKAGAAINTSGDKKGSYNIGVNYEF
ncbi:YadA-like family protein [Moraxella catarrhalis]|nr:YadA-like family protein [Moraxella catarrhalis]